MGRPHKWPGHCEEEKISAPADQWTPNSLTVNLQPNHYTLHCTWIVLEVHITYDLLKGIFFLFSIVIVSFTVKLWLQISLCRKNRRECIVVDTIHVTKQNISTNTRLTVGYNTVYKNTCPEVLKSEWTFFSFQIFQINYENFQVWRGKSSKSTSILKQ